MAQSIVSREELLENAYQIAERNGVSALSVRGLANATGVSVGTVYRHFSAKDELTTATIQLYFKYAFYERFCHRISADLPDGFDAESVCRFVIENVMGSLHHQNGNCDVLFGLLERTLYANRTQ